MPDTAGTMLLQLLRSAITSLLSDALSELRHATDLSALGPAGPEWAGSGFEAHLLQPVTTTLPASPVTARVVAALQKLSHVTGPSATAGLFGWNPDPVGHTRQPGIACAIRISGPSPAMKFAAALAITLDNGQPAVAIVAHGDSGPQSGGLPLDDQWALTAGGKITDTFEVDLPATGPATVTHANNGDVIRLGLTRQATPAAGVGPGIDLGAIAFDVALTLAGATPDLSGAMRITGGAIRIAPDDLSSIVPTLAPIPLDVALGISSTKGVDVAGSTTLEVRLPTGGSHLGVTTGPLDLVLTAQPGGAGPRVQVHVSCPVSLNLPAVPIHLDVDGMGFDLPFQLGGAGLGFDLSALAPQIPTGAGATLALPIVQGAGHLQHSGTSYSGTLAVVMPPLAVNALGTLDTHTASFLVILGAVFPPPGIQIGFGFAVTGVGGIVGVNRRIDRDALTQAVQDGTAASLLFPTDPAKAAQETLPTLDRLFPSHSGSVIVGPMFQISWGGRLLTGSVALVLELPDPVRMSIIGKVVLAVPDPALPLIRMQITFFGQIDPAEPSLTFLASLSDSTIAGIPITGDMFVLVRGGSNADVIVSAGGFHPKYTRPPGVPALNRIAMTLSSGPLLQLRCQAYLAVTSNTVQFGARADLVAEIAGCGLRGSLGFDVLIQFSPFHFLAEISAAVAVEVLDETLVGVALQLSLEGPGLWRARGRGSIDLFLFSTSLDFDESWGSQPLQDLGTPDIEGTLRDAFAQPDAWTAAAPDPAAAPVQLTIDAGRLLADGTRVHPHGALSAQQRRVPLGITIDRFNRIPIAPQQWDVGNPTLGGVPDPTSGELREQFAPGAYLSMTDDEQLSRPSFESFGAGLSFVAGGVTVAAERSTDFDYETSVVSNIVAGNNALQVDLQSLVAPAEQVSRAGIDDPRWWRPQSDVVTVTPAPALAAANAWSMTEATDVAAPSTNATEQYDAVNAARTADPTRNIGVVEAWEVAPA